MASARVFFSKRRQQRNGFISEEVPVVENGYDAQESEEDEVFVQDPSLEISATKPLMHPRNKGHRTKIKTRTLECRICALCKPIFYFVVLVTVLCSVMATIVYIANRHKDHGNKSLVHDGFEPNTQQQTEKRIILIGCDTLEVEDVWTVGFPKLLTESAFRMLDVNGDGVDDVIFGFATGADGFSANDIVCDLYFKGQRPCLGGVMALDGLNGHELWRHYTDHEAYALNCQYDVDQDGTRDCVVGGRAGVLVCISGKDGALIWTLGSNSEARLAVMNFYTPQYVNDLDGDGVADLLAVHGGDPLQQPGSKSRLPGRLLLLSGKTGKLIRWLGVPDGRESYYSPQVLTRPEDVRVVLFGTGGETHNGSLWRLELNSLLQGRGDRAVKISSDTHKGFMTPPALVDLTGDGVEDILVPSFNSTLLAVDGQSFQPLWSVRFESSETYSTPAVGFYNDDETPDALVKFAYGPGYPVYYYSQTTVIDGKTGARLIDPPLKDTIGSQSSGLTVAMEGTGNDVFLVWTADCEGHERATDSFSFTKDATLKDKSHSDLCRLRFQSKGVARLLALSRHLPRDGALVYNSVNRKTLEHSQWVNTTQEAYDYVMKHPEILDNYQTNSKDELLRPPGADKSAEEERERQRVREEEAEAREEAELFGGPKYANNLPRTSSKKGPSSSLPASSARRQNPSPRGNLNDDLARRGRQRGGSPLSSHYLDQPQKSAYPSDLLNQNSRLFPQNSRDDEYGFPYRDDGGTNNNGYYGKQYSSYYPSSGRNRDDDDIGYQDGFPYGYEAYPQRRRISGRKRKGAGGYPRTRRKRGAGRIYDKRHVGPHDDDGIQRLISTGTLAPTSLPKDHVDYNRTIDVIFATYWMFPVHTSAILAKDQKCISDNLGKEMIARFDEDSPYFQMSHEEFEKAVTDECLRKSGHQLPEEGTYRASDQNYNPFKINMGQMTVYRLRLKLTCSQEANSTETDSRCATVLPFAKQRWASYMGSNGDSHWRPPFH